MSEAKKFDDGKPPLNLLDRLALEETARVLAFGAKKYDEENWRADGEYTLGSKRPLAAALRHVYAYLDGEQLDPESGLSHLGHALCSVMFALAAELRGKGDVKPCKAPENDYGGCEYCTTDDGIGRHADGLFFMNFGLNEGGIYRYLCDACTRINGPWKRMS